MSKKRKKRSRSTRRERRCARHIQSTMAKGGVVFTTSPQDKMDVIDRTFLPVYYAFNMTRHETRSDCVLDWFAKSCWERVIFAKGCVGKLKWFYEDLGKKSVKKLDALVKEAFTKHGLETMEEMPDFYARLRRLLLDTVPLLQSFYSSDEKKQGDTMFMVWEPLDYEIEEWQEFESWSKRNDYSFFDRRSKPTT